MTSMSGNFSIFHSSKYLKNCQGFAHLTDSNSKFEYGIDLEIPEQRVKTPPVFGVNLLMKNYNVTSCWKGIGFGSGLDICSMCFISIQMTSLIVTNVVVCRSGAAGNRWNTVSGFNPTAETIFSKQSCINQRDRKYNHNMPHFLRGRLIKKMKNIHSSDLKLFRQRHCL